MRQVPSASTFPRAVAEIYDLLDSADDMPQLCQVSEELGHIAIIDPNPRRNGVAAEKLFDPATHGRYKQRTTVERGNSRL